MKQLDPKPTEPNIFMLHLICCGGPLLAFVVISLAPTLIAFLLTYKVWVLAVGISVVAGGTFVWWRRARRVRRPAGDNQQIEPARVQQP